MVSQYSLTENTVSLLDQYSPRDLNQQINEIVQNTNFPILKKNYGVVWEIPTLSIDETLPQRLRTSLPQSFIKHV